MKSNLDQQYVKIGLDDDLCKTCRQQICQYVNCIEFSAVCKQNRKAGREHDFCCLIGFKIFCWHCQLGSKNVTSDFQVSAAAQTSAAAQNFIVPYSLTKTQTRI